MLSQRAINVVFSCTLVSFSIAAGCTNIERETEGDVVRSGQAVVDPTLPGTDPAAFAEAAEAFGAVEGILDGLGPIFNERGCGSCHTTPIMGGSGEQLERRFGRVVSGIFDELASQGGSLRQLFTNATYNNGQTLCSIPLEVEPPNATVHNIGRRTTPLFGLGLVDAMPDAFFDGLAAAQPAAIRGIAHRVPVVLPDPRDAAQGIGTLRVARFGWKSSVPSLIQFSADAYLNEMGITTQSCFQGQSLLAFAFENLPNGIAPPAGCNGGDLALANPPGNPQVPEFTDDPVGSCDNGRTEIQDDVLLFTTFMERLAPQPRDMTDAITIARGDPLFTQVGCAGCHVRTTFVTPAQPFNGVPGSFAFNPYSDFLIHDMGNLGDRVGSTGDSVAATRRMRTAPLWGARFNNRYLHDARAADISQAILAHDGQALAARNAFSALSAANRHAVVQFVRSL